MRAFSSGPARLLTWFQLAKVGVKNKEPSGQRTTVELLSLPTAHPGTLRGTRNPFRENVVLPTLMW